MIFLLLSILSSTGIFIIFKSLKTFKIDTLQTIVINYITACIFGLVHHNQPIKTLELFSSHWFLPAFCLGVLFIAIFNVMALTAQKNGLSVASVASKMSVVIPVLFGIVVFNESIGVQKILGIILALIAVYLTSIKSAEKIVLTSAIYLPIILFIGSGIIETSVNYFAPDDKIALFSACIFGSAFIVGTVLLAFRFFSQKKRLKLKSLPMGILLGAINYASIYFLLKALRIEGLESSTLFTINNVAIVALTTLVGLFIFSERLSIKNWIGLGLALTSIIMITMA